MDIVICIPSPTLMIGALVGLSALGWQARALKQRSRTALVVIMLVYGLISFAISFALSSRLAADAYLPLFDSLVNPRDGTLPQAVTEEALEQAANVTRELWRRVLVPPPLREPCYTEEEAVCAAADDVAPAVLGGNWGWESYMQLIGRGLISAALTLTLIWGGTRARADEPEMDDLEDAETESHRRDEDD
jgi:hypothetical protein